MSKIVLKNCTQHPIGLCFAEGHDVITHWVEPVVINRETKARTGGFLEIEESALVRAKQSPVVLNWLKCGDLVEISAEEYQRQLKTAKKGKANEEK